jgi:hypothetical protein
MLYALCFFFLFHVILSERNKFEESERMDKRSLYVIIVVSYHCQVVFSPIK